MLMPAGRSTAVQIDQSYRTQAGSTQLCRKLGASTSSRHSQEPCELAHTGAVTGAIGLRAQGELELMAICSQRWHCRSCLRTCLNTLCVHFAEDRSFNDACHVRPKCCYPKPLLAPSPGCPKPYAPFSQGQHLSPLPVPPSTHPVPLEYPLSLIRPFNPRSKL